MRYEARNVSLDSGAVVNIIVQLDVSSDGKQFVSSIESSGRVDGTPLLPSDMAAVRGHILGTRSVLDEGLRGQRAKVA